MTTTGQSGTPEPPKAPPTAPAAGTLREGRCHECGYSLVGLTVPGPCPECGSAFDAASARRLQPWPSALEICFRLGWPVVGLVVAGVLLTTDDGAPMGFLLGWAMIVAVGVNSYFQVRWMLRRSLPNAVRTRGPVAVARAIGTTICVVIVLLFVALPLVLGIGCLLVVANNV